MENSRLYGILEKELLYKWRKEVEEAESQSWFFCRVRETFEQLEKTLGEQEKELLKSYSLALESKLDFVYSILNIKLLNFSIKIGMDIEKCLAEIVLD